MERYLSSIAESIFEGLFPGNQSGNTFIFNKGCGRNKNYRGAARRTDGSFSQISCSKVNIIFFPPVEFNKKQLRVFTKGNYLAGSG
jgi:hypothetical protein